LICFSLAHCSLLGYTIMYSGRWVQMFFTSALKNEAVNPSVTLVHTYDTSTWSHNSQDNSINLKHQEGVWSCIFLYWHWKYTKKYQTSLLGWRLFSWMGALSLLIQKPSFSLTVEQKVPVTKVMSDIPVTCHPPSLHQIQAKSKHCFWTISSASNLWVSFHLQWKACRYGKVTVIDENAIIKKCADFLNICLLLLSSPLY
jgi:hypothetical protein